MRLHVARLAPAARGLLVTLAVAALLLCAEPVSSAPPAAPGVGQVSEWALAWQMALERISFSPGLIDGQVGPKTRLATGEFQRIRGLPVTGELDDATARALGLDRSRPDSVKDYVIQESDLKQVGPLPDGWVQKSKAERLPYPSLQEMLAEKFHTKQSTLAALNGAGQADWQERTLRVGDRIRAPNLAAPVAPATARRVEIDLDEKVVRVIGEGGRLEALFHCSVAAKKENRPSGQARVTLVSYGPSYVFDPMMWPEVTGIDHKLVLPPGPRNPVGLCWIGLSLPGYGLHGSPSPELIGKTGSHGCFRLTNWDACRLGWMVRVGTPVVFRSSDQVTQIAQARP